MRIYSVFRELVDIAPAWSLDLVTALSANTPKNIPLGGVGGNVAGPVSLLSNYEFWLTVCVLIFGVFSIVLSCRYVSKENSSQPEYIIRVIAVNLIVIGTLVTITGGLSDKQIAPAFGLFGTIAGYLLGKSEKNPLESKNKPEE